MTTRNAATPRSWASGHLFMVLVAIGCGLAGGMGAVVFRELIQIVQKGFYGHGGELLDVARSLPWYWRLLAPAAGGLLVGPLVYFFAREAKGHGVPEVMEAVALRGGAIRPRVVAVKAIASALSIGTGGSVGREGPIVQIGSALSSTIGQILRVPSRHLRTLVGCGAAAGIAATFNAPIAGALFAVEIILGDFGVTQFSPIVISSVVATVLSRHFLGDFPAFEVPGYALVSPFELLPYMALGVIAAVVGTAFVKILYRTEDFVERLPVPGYITAAIGGLLVGAIGIGLPQVFGVGYATMNAALTGNIPVTILVVLLVAKILATSITIGSGGSGGVFAPSLFLGAVTGGLVGTLLHQWFPASTATSGAYALVGMSAVVAATTHAPITAIIMIFEMTGDYTIIPALMSACVVSTLTATWMGKESIYTLKLIRRGVELFKEEDPNVLKALRVSDIVDREPDVIPASAKFPVVLDLVVRSRHSEFFVVNDRNELIGVIEVAKLRRLIFDQEALRHLIVAEDLIVTGRPAVTERDHLDLVMRLFSHSAMDEIPVVSEMDRRKLVGVVRKEDVINARNREWLRKDLTGTLTTTVSFVGTARQVDIGDGYVVQEILAPPVLLGRTLAELNLPGAYGAHVVFIRSRLGGEGEMHIRVPSSGDRIVEGDTLVIAGLKKAVERVEAL
ncbi:MAG: chloride channel protein [Myxococcota bacterium]